MNETKTLLNVKSVCVCMRCAGKGGTLLALTSLIKQEISIIEFVLCFCLHDVLYVRLFVFFPRCFSILVCIESMSAFLPIQSLKLFCSVFSSFRVPSSFYLKIVCHRECLHTFWLVVVVAVDFFVSLLFLHFIHSASNRI